jgi:beta-barrel assembly-enhancing protease
MKRLLSLLIILLAAVAALYFAQDRQARDAVGANAVVDLAADLQRDVTRVPMRVTRLSDADEVRIGEELARRYGLSTAPQTPEMSSAQGYINRAGARVAAHTWRKLVFHFYLDPNPELMNTFALPGGHVVVGLGLINQMKSEDELVFVLAHEIVHIDHYHTIERVQIEAQLHKVGLDSFAALAQIPLSLWQAGYSKDEEFVADREGLFLAASAGYSPRGAINLLTRFVQLDREYVIHADTPTGEFSQSAIEGLMGYFRSHPLASERLARVKALIIEEHLSPNQPITPLQIGSQTHPKYQP